MSGYCYQPINRVSGKRVTCAAVQAVVTEYFGLAPGELLASRARRVTWARQMAIALARRHSGLSLPEIGRRFGGLDHTTVLFALRQVEARRAALPEYCADMRALEVRVSAACPSDITRDLARGVFRTQRLSQATASFRSCRGEGVPE